MAKDFVVDDKFISTLVNSLTYNNRKLVIEKNPCFSFDGEASTRIDIFKNGFFINTYLASIGRRPTSIDGLDLLYADTLKKGFAEKIQPYLKQYCEDKDLRLRINGKYIPIYSSD